MADAIILDSADGSSGRIISGGVTFYGPIPPRSGELLDRYGALLAAGVTPTPFAPPAVDLLTYARTKQAAILAAGRTFNVAADGQAAKMILCDGTNSTRADLALMVLNAQANTSVTQTWIDNEGGSSVLASAEVIALATAAGNWMSGTYTAMSNVLSGLAASPPTITAAAQIDAAFAPATPSS